MNRTIAIARRTAAQRLDAIEGAMRAGIVLGCGLALVLAGKPLPF